MKSDVDTAKQDLRELLSTIVIDFDRHAGAFTGLNYHSPWIAATEEWARRSGYAVDELRGAITHQRTALILGRKMDVRVARIIDDFQRAVQEWRSETGYSDPPFQLAPDDVRFSNYKELKEHILRCRDLDGLEQTYVRYEVGDLKFGGFFNDRFDHRVSARMIVKLRAGGKIRLDFVFPYYGTDEPRSLTLSQLTASALRDKLGLPQMPQLEWVVSKSKTDFKEIDDVLAIMKAIVSYLRPTIH